MVKTAWLTLNRNCNLKCEWCYAKESMNNKAMNFEILKDIITKLNAQSVNKVILIGGEPLIYSHIFELCEIISKYDMKQSVTTNGIALANFDNCNKLISSGLKSYNMSLKGISNDDYFVNAKFKNGLDYFIKAYNNLKKLDINPLISYVIVDDDKKKFEKLIELFEINNMTDVSFQFVKPVLSMNNENNSIMTMDKMGGFCEYLFKRMSKTKINFSIELSFPLCLIDNNVLRQMIEKKVLSTCCHIQKGTGLILDTDFKILPCNHFANYPFDIENINFEEDEFISKAFESDSVIDFRKKVSCYPSVKCEQCNLWDCCGGGCFTRWLYNNPSDYIK